MEETATVTCVKCMFNALRGQLCQLLSSQELFLKSYCHKLVI